MFDAGVCLRRFSYVAALTKVTPAETSDHSELSSIVHLPSLINHTLLWPHITPSFLCLLMISVPKHA